MGRKHIYRIRHLTGNFVETLLIVVINIHHSEVPTDVSDGFAVVTPRILVQHH